jgi:tetratricopeptide (TPR) repeat protein
MDPANPVVKLCVDGMQEEFQRRYAEARSLFWRAWELRSDDVEACIAAHYLARHQHDPSDQLHWNAESLRFAQRAPGASVRSFLPSLYLNLGKSYEDLGDFERARECYEAAKEFFSTLPVGPYSELVEGGVFAGLSRVTPPGGVRAIRPIALSERQDSDVVADGQAPAVLGGTRPQLINRDRQPLDL